MSYNVFWLYVAPPPAIPAWSTPLPYLPTLAQHVLHPNLSFPSLYSSQPLSPRTIPPPLPVRKEQTSLRCQPNGITCYSKTGRISSYQGWTMQPSRRKGVPKVDKKSQRQPPLTRAPNYTAIIYMQRIQLRAMQAPWLSLQSLRAPMNLAWLILWTTFSWCLWHLWLLQSSPPSSAGFLELCLMSLQLLPSAARWSLSQLFCDTRLYSRNVCFCAPSSQIILRIE